MFVHYVYCMYIISILIYTYIKKSSESALCQPRKYKKLSESDWKKQISYATKKVLTISKEYKFPEKCLCGSVTHKEINKSTKKINTKSLRFSI